MGDVSGIHILVVGGAGIVGGIVAVVVRRSFLQIATSLMGGSGLALSVQLIATRAEWALSGWVLVVTIFVSTVCGVLAQRFLRKRRKATVTSEKT